MIFRNNIMISGDVERSIDEPTVVAGCVIALIDFAVQRGANYATLLERSMIDQDELSDRDGRLPFMKYVALTRAASDLCGDPALALHFGERVDVSEVSIACTVGGVSTIDQAIGQLNRYASLGVEVETVGDGGRFVLRRGGGQLWMVDCRRNPNTFPELTEAAFARLVCSVRRNLGDVSFFQEIHFTHAEPSYRAEYDRIFRMPLSFGSGENAIRFDESKIAAYSAPKSSRFINGVLKDHAEAMLQKLEKGKSTRHRVEKVLLPMLCQRTANIDMTARKLGVTRQTLFRKLKSEGVTFKTVLSDLRLSLAHHHLKDGKASVKETAYLLGFSDPAAFSRAFKKWTGLTPSEVRGT